MKLSLGNLVPSFKTSQVALEKQTKDFEKMEVNLKTMYGHYKLYTLTSSNKRMKSLEQSSASMGRPFTVLNQEGMFRFEDQQGLSARQDFGKEVQELWAKVNSI